MPSPDFDASTLPWVDSDDFPEVLEARLTEGRIEPEQAERLRRWREDGYLRLPGAVAPEAIDRLLADVETAWTTPWPLSVLVEGRGVTPLAQMPPRHELEHRHYRLLDVQDDSDAARELVLHRDLLAFLRLVFEDTPVAMQSLFFEYGSEQGTHQDFPYVQSGIPSHLAGCWIACEPVDEDNGPLFYYPGSHRLPKFDWGGGDILFDGEDEKRVEAFGEYLERACAEHGLERESFRAQKGDVVFWHAALVHGGSPARDPQRTRRSLVVHYSSATAYPRDRRWPYLPPKLLERDGGRVYLRRHPSLIARAWGRAGRLLERLRSRR